MQSFFACRGGYYPPEVISVTAEHPSIAEIKISILLVGVGAPTTQGIYGFVQKPLKPVILSEQRSCVSNFWESER